MTSAFDWNQFEKVAPEPKAEPQAQAAFDWNQFEKVSEAGQQPQQSGILRDVARTGARIGETLAGLPGDIANLPKAAMRFIAGKISPKAKENVEGALSIASGVFPGANLPTSEKLRQEAKKVAGEYLEPQTRGERISDEVASDFASLAVPIKGKVPFLKTLGRSLGISTVATGAGELAEEFGAEESGKGATKMGAMFLGSMFNPQGASKYVSKLYADAKDLLPEGAKAPAKNLAKELNGLSKELVKGGSAPSKTKAIQKISEINGKISKGMVPVDELTEFKKSVNEARAGLYEEFKSDKVGRKMAKRNLDSVSKAIDNSLKEYGQTHPEWNKLYQDANAGYGAIAQSKKISSNVAKMIKSHPHLHATAIAALAGQLFLAPKTIALAASGYGAVKSAELMARIGKSPVLRKYYMQAVNAAAKEDSAAFVRNIAKIDSELNK
jgi:hypothetical protein